MRLVLPTLLLLSSLALGAAGCTPEDGSEAAGTVDPTALPGTPGPVSADSLLAGDAGLAQVDSAGAKRPAPRFALPALGGDTLRLADYAGRVVLVNFWATWCPPCRAEIPDLNRLYEDLEAEGLTIIGVSMDEEGLEAVRPFAEEYGIRYPLVVDDGRVAAEFGGVWGLPTTFVVDPEGLVVDRIIGVFPADEMRAELAAMLERTAAG